MNIFDTFPALNTSFQAFGLALFHSLWQGIIIGLLCSLVLRMMHREMASLRFIVAYTALVLLFLTFAGTFYMQYHTLSGAAQEITFNTTILDKEIPTTVGMASSQGGWWTGVTVFYQKYIQKLIAYTPFIVICWLLGFLWYITQLTIGLCQTRQMKRRSHVPEGKWVAMLQHLQHKIKIQHKIQLLVSSQADAPFTLGWIKPVILIPPSIFTELSADQLETILVHELAHIKRHDYLLNIIQSVIEVFLFFNPVYWYIASVLEKEREQACDQMTISTIQHPMTYARALTRLAEISHNTSSDIAIAAIGKQNLQQRIHNLMQNSSYTSRHGKQAAFKWYQLLAIAFFGILFTILTVDVNGNQANNLVEPQILVADSVSMVSGQVTDQETGEPLPGINIIIKGTTTGTVTNPEGIYQIQASTPEDKLVFFFTGYEKEEVSIKNQEEINIKMQKDDQEIIEVPVEYMIEVPIDENDSHIKFKKEKEKGNDLAKPVIIEVPIYEEVSHEKSVIQGKVVDAQTGEPLLGTNVIIKGTPTGTVTDMLGHFTLKIPAETESLVFSFIGYQEKEVSVTAKTDLDVKLQNLNDSLRISTSKSYSPLDSQTILYIIDGVVQGSDKAVLAKIDPANIKSVEVLKNNGESFNKAARAYIKGAKQTYDGVIIIRTKDENYQHLSNKDDQSFENNLLVFPNPSDQKFAVQFKLNETAKVKVIVTDKNGKQAALLTDQMYSPGAHHIEWNSGIRKPGIYMIKIIRGNESFTRKVVLE